VNWELYSPIHRFLFAIMKTGRIRGYEVELLKAKDLLTAIQVDAAGEMKKLSSYTYVFVKDGEQQTNHLVVKVEGEKIVLTKQSDALLTLNQLIIVLNEAKEADIFVEDELVFGYKLVKQGIVLG